MSLKNALERTTQPSHGSGRLERIRHLSKGKPGGGIQEDHRLIGWVYGREFIMQGCRVQFYRPGPLTRMAIQIPRSSAISQLPGFTKPSPTDRASPLFVPGNGNAALEVSTPLSNHGR